MSKIKKYIIKVDPSISTNSALHFTTRVKELLSIDNAWPGYEFEYVGLHQGYKTSHTPPADTYDIIITLLSRKIKHKLLELTGAELADQPSEDGYGNKIDFDKVELSYTFYNTPTVIVIDDGNWNSAHEKLNIKKEDYESYVILHEVGHAIGKGHMPIPEDASKPYPIMYQATLGLPDISRFRPVPNESDEI